MLFICFLVINHVCWHPGHIAHLTEEQEVPGLNRVQHIILWKFIKKSFLRSFLAHLYECTGRAIALSLALASAKC